jgi:arylsulfatase A-like enzyme
MMGLYSLCRIGFYLYNTAFFPDMTPGNFLYLMLGGLKFDLSAILYTNALFILLLIIPLDYRFHPGFKKGLTIWFFLTNGVALAMNVADFIYYRFTLRRTTADIFRQFEHETNLGSLFFRFLFDYWYATVFFVALVVIMVVVYNRLGYSGPQVQRPLSYYGGGILCMLSIVYLVIGGMRGGFRESTRPITLSNAGEYVRNPRDISIVLNTPFALFRTVGKTRVAPVQYYTEDELETVYSPVHDLPDTLNARNDNVVIIILESFSREFIGFLNRDKENGTYRGYTPFLDSLLEHSLTFDYTFSNGRKSIDGLPSVVSSIPSLGVPYFLSPYSSNRINSVASLLKERGYYSAFFHGAPNGSMGFAAFTNLAGFDDYYGLNEYGNSDDFDGIWGIWDHKFFDYFATQLGTFRQPFVATMFSVSSHHPFEIPEEFKDRFKGGPLPIQKCIQYTDYALKEFFAKASRMPWFENTLFVITADHCSSNIYFPEGHTAWGLYSVPVIFFKPDNSLSGVQRTIAQQIDIMPTVLGYLGYTDPYVAFGRDLFHPDNDTPFAFNFNDNVYQLMMDDHLLMFDGQKTVGFYNYVTDPLMKTDLKEKGGELLTKMEDKLKAVIQQYNNRMVEDRLVLPSSLSGPMGVKGM